MVEAKENRFFIFLFRYYTRLLFKRRFDGVWLKSSYEPRGGTPVIYYSNHNSWWDGLIPFLLNEFLWGHNGRAMMEEDQIRNYSFFRRIGAFSVNRKDRRDVISSLRYATESLKREHPCLYLYPEGKIVPFHESLEPTFEGGLTWLAYHRADLDVVPVGLYIHTMQSDKPRLLIRIGEALKLPSGEDSDNRSRTAFLEDSLGNYLKEISVRSEPEAMGFRRWV